MNDREEEKKETKSGKASETDGDILNLKERFLIRVPARHNARLQKIIARVNEDDRLSNHILN
jgi:hypothetical protein